MKTAAKLEKKLLHYLGKAIADYKMLQHNDRVMVCLSGGKDSYTLLRLLHLFRQRAHRQFEIFAFTLDQSQPGWDDSGMRAWLGNMPANNMRTRRPFPILAVPFP